MKTIQLSEKHVIKRSNKLFDQLDCFSFRSKNLYNSGLYRNRSIYFGNKYEGTKNKLETYNQQAGLLKTHNDYLALPAKVAQQVLKLVDKNWKSFWTAFKEYQKNPSKFKVEPKPPKYLGTKSLGYDDGRFVTTFTIQALSKTELEKGCIKLTEGHISFKSRIAKKAVKNPNKYQINQVRIVPKNGYYVLEVVYTKIVKVVKTIKDRIASIDIGTKILAALVFNGKVKPRLFSGKVLTNINSYYNSRIAKAQSKLPKRINPKTGIGTSKRIQDLWRRRERKNQRLSS